MNPDQTDPRLRSSLIYVYIVCITNVHCQMNRAKQTTIIVNGVEKGYSAPNFEKVEGAYALGLSVPASNLVSVTSLR